MESRDLLSATPFDAPDPINFGIISHDNTCHVHQEQQNDSDTFTISWNGGEEGTVLSQLTIDLSTANSSYNLLFDKWSFNSTTTGVQHNISDNGKVLTIRFGEQFTAGTLEFTVSVYRQETSNETSPVTDGLMMQGATVEAVFQKKDFYKDMQIQGKFERNYADPDKYNLGHLPKNDTCAHGQGNGATTAGVFATGEQEALTGTLSGFVYHDRNNDGIKGTGEEGIANSTLSLWKWNEALQCYEDTGARAVTNSQGAYKFEDVAAFETYQVRQVQQPTGWQDGKETVGTLGGITNGTLPASDNDTIGEIRMSANGKGENYNFGENKSGSISGFVYHDKNNDGIKETGEEGIANAMLSLWKWNGTAYVDTGERATTDAHGQYVFENVKAFEQYQVRQAQPTGWQDGKETVGTLGGTLPTIDNDTIGGIWMPTEGVGENYNFGEHKGGAISGYVYHDRNNNGIKETGEEGIANVTLALWVWNGTTYVDSGAKTTTDATGKYTFTNVRAFETYQIRQTQPAGWQDGKESVGTLGGILSTIDNDTIGGIVVSNAEIGENYNFGEYKNGSISGRVYEDGGDPIPDTTVELYDRDGKKIGETKTDKDGRYEFTDIPPGEYWVKEYRDDKYCGGGGFAGDLGGEYRSDDNSIRDIVVGSDEDGKNYDFFANRRGEVSGYVYLDVDKSESRSQIDNHGKTEWEPGIAGVELSLYVWDAEKNEYRDTGKRAITDENGYYKFTGLCSGYTFKILATHPNGDDCWLVSVGTMDGEKTGNKQNDAVSEIGMSPNGHGEDYNFGKQLPQETPPPVVPFIPVTPPTPPPFSVPSEPQSTGGYYAGAGLPGWQAANFTAPLQGGYGSGGVVAAAENYSWQLSIINAGYPRANGATDGIAVGEHASKTTAILSDYDSVASGAAYVSVSWTPLPMKQSSWLVRGKDGVVRKRFTFGPEGGIPVVGDFSGDGIANIAVYHDGNWYIDINGNGIWDEEDLWAQMGGQADQPVAGDWDGDGKTDIGFFGPMGGKDSQFVASKPGLPTDLNTTISTVPKNVPPDVAISELSNNVRAMKHSANGGVRLDVVDHVFQYGSAGDKAFTGDFTGDGIATIGVYRNGKWYIDKSGTGRWDESAVFVNNADFGLGPEGIPVIGDFDGDGIDNIGLYVDGVWYLDTTGDFRFNERVEFGQPDDYPVVGDFDGSGIAQLAVYRANSADLLAGATPPEPIHASGAGMVASQFGANGEISEADQESLKNHGRSVQTPHTNAPLLRGQ